MLTGIYILVATIVGWLAGGKYSRDRVRLGVSRLNIEAFIKAWETRNNEDAFVVFDKKGYNIFTKKHDE